MLRKAVIGCGGLIGVLIVLGIIGGIISAATGGNQGSQNQPSSPSAPSTPSASPTPPLAPTTPPAQSGSSGTATVRVSGTPGTPFSCSYGTLSSGQTSADGTLADQPTEYQVPIKSGAFALDSVTASCQKQAQAGDLKLEIASGGQTKKTQETSAAYGVATTTWSTQEK